jgi:hypothetical protein
MRLVDILESEVDEVKSAEELEKELEELMAEYEKESQSKAVKEGMFDTTIADLDKKFEAAKRALGIMNKLKRGDGSNAKWASRTMTLLNSIRATVTFLKKQSAKLGTNSIQQAAANAAKELNS